MNYNIYEPVNYFFNGTIFRTESETIFVTLAFVFFSWWVIKKMRSEKAKMKAKEISFLLFAAIFGSLAGGRLWYYFTYWDGLRTVIAIFDLSIPGLTSYGMILGGIIGVMLFTVAYGREKKKDWRTFFAKYIDIFAISAGLFVFIYRMGCFHFGDVPGTATTLPWGLFAVHYGIYSGMIMHPTALYLSFSALLIFLFLNWYNERKRFDGEIGLLFLMAYSFNRLWIEFLRAGSEKFLGMNHGQWVLLVFFAVSSFWYMVLKDA